MQKLNKLGVELLDLKNEVLKDHPAIITKSLMLHAESLVSNAMIDVDTHLALTNEKMLKEDFENYLLEQKKCIKSEEELLSDYELIREQIVEQIKMLGYDKEIESESIVQREELSFIQTFKITKSWTKKYFGVDDKDVETLFRRKSFVEKFSVLRLPAILNQYMETHPVQNASLLEVLISDPFYDAELEIYCVSLFSKVSIDKAEEISEQSLIAEQLKNIFETSEVFVEERL